MKFLLVIVSVIAVTYGHSPVLLWPAQEFAIPEGQSALDSMNLDDFKKLFEGKKIVIFHKKQFAVEEVSYPDKPLSYLKNEDIIALQGVKSIHHFIGGLASSENLKFVRLGEASLHEQQKQIEDAMKSNPGFASILVGSGTHRSRREAKAEKPEPKCVSLKDEECTAYVGAVKIGKEAKDGGCEVSCINGTGLDITITDESKKTLIKLVVTKDVKSGGYYIDVSDKSAYELDSETKWAPDGFSYSCLSLPLIPKEKDGKIITLGRVQLYPGKRNADGKKVFPDSYDCATWFTPAIWMGAVVAIFYIFLLFGAVVFLLDVKTNDRFDDPKGKTITVNVAE